MPTGQHMQFVSPCLYLASPCTNRQSSVAFTDIASAMATSEALDFLSTSIPRVFSAGPWPLFFINNGTVKSFFFVMSTTDQEFFIHCTEKLNDRYLWHLPFQPPNSNEWLVHSLWPTIPQTFMEICRIPILDIQNKLSWFGLCNYKPLHYEQAMLCKFKII